MRQGRREVVVIDRHQIDPIPLQPLGFVDGRHHHFALVSFRIKASIIATEAQETTFVASDHRQLLGEFRQPPIGVALAHPPQQHGQLVGQSQISHLLEQILGQGEDQLVYGQQRRFLPAADQSTEGDQLLAQDGEFINQVQAIQPVLMHSRPQKILDLPALAQRWDDFLKKNVSLLVVTVTTPPHFVDPRQLGRRGGIGQVVDDVAQRPCRLAG